MFRQDGLLCLLLVLGLSCKQAGASQHEVSNASGIKPLSSLLCFLLCSASTGPNLAVKATLAGLHNGIVQMVTVALAVYISKDTFDLRRERVIITCFGR